MSRNTSPEASSGHSPREVLARHWGYDSFRTGQDLAVESVLRGEDVLAVLPTGGGKSVCYQVPAVVLDGLTVVVSPLIALMQDQVAGLNARGIQATFINSQLPYREAEQRWLDAEYGRYRLLYLAPERLESDVFRARGPRLPVKLLAVDEAHCISEWGPDFRPSYRRIAEGADLLGRPPIVAVTATATPQVRKDIVEQLGLAHPRVIVRGFDRPNIVPGVFLTSAKLEKVREVFRAVEGPGIVYVTSRRSAETWAERLSKSGISAAAYHAGMSPASRLDVQERWQRDQVRVIAATNAFGMGIDKPDVRAVVHVDLPPSIEAYYQEAGRAGRDGRRAYSVLVFSESDVADARGFAEESRPTADLVQRVYETALSIAQIAIGSESDEPFLLDANTIGGIVERSPMAVRAAAEALVRDGIFELVRMREDVPLVRFSMTVDDFRGYAAGREQPALRRFIEEVLRFVRPEAFRGWVEMDVRQLASRMGLTPERVIEGLTFLARQDAMRLIVPGEGVWYRLNGPRTERVQVDRSALEASRHRAHSRLDHVIRYARAITCRRRLLLSYFGEPAPESCGACDICTGRHRPPVITPEDEPHLIQLLRHVREGDRQEDWLSGSGLPPHRIDGLADWLVHEGYIRAADVVQGRYELTESGKRRLD